MTKGSTSRTRERPYPSKMVKSLETDIMEPWTEARPARNDEIDWDKFDPKAYCDRNYRKLRDDDRIIVSVVRDFFAGSDVRPGARGLDIGAGANLYPSLAMLPFCDRVDLWELSKKNVRWLRRRRWLWFGRRWKPFRRIYAENNSYAGHHLRWEFLRKVRIRQENIFDLPEHAWDIGTMFFVACSLSTHRSEFDRAVRCFVRSLKPGAPFAAAFMVRSKGYKVADRSFPAVSVKEEDVDRSLRELVDDMKLYPIASIDPLRTGVGMLLVTGRARST